MLRNSAALRHQGETQMTTMVHGSAVIIGGLGVLIVGPSGSGKSDLALRLIDRGAKLISDDILYIESADGVPILAYAPSIAGKIEVRGIGICSMEYDVSAPLRLVVACAKDVDRMPAEDMRTTIADFLVPLVKLDPFQVSSVLKVELALRSVVEAGHLPAAISPAIAIERVES
jgi:serine kinase of HPr protein (carbohydrate metabolism regulator)